MKFYKARNKRIILYIIIYLFINVKFFSSSIVRFNFGKLLLPLTFNNTELSFCPTLVVPEVYLINERNGLYCNISPFELKFKYNRKEYRLDKYIQSWELVDVPFINSNLGWMKQLNKKILFESYIRINTVSVIDISNFYISPILEISLLTSLLDEIINLDRIYFMTKALSIQIGASFKNNNYRPDFFIATSIDFVLFAGLIGLIGHL